MSSSDRRPYLSAVALTQDVLDNSADNLTGRLEMVADLESPTGTLRLSDRAKYVEGTFYEPRVEFPVIRRPIGDWLAGGEIEFPTMELVINNADKKFSDVLPGGASYNGWIGRRLTIKVGLAELGSSYTTIFTGPITDVGGFSRDTTTFTVTARSDFERVNIAIPNQLLIPEDFPDIEDDFVGLGAPIIYGDWTINLGAQPEVPALPVNGADANVIAGTDPVRAVISSVPLKSVDTTSVVLLRGDEYFSIPAGDVSIVPLTDNQLIDIDQQGFDIDGSPWIYENGDQIYLRCEGVDLITYDTNIVWQARDILIRFGGLDPLDFDAAAWQTYRDKAAPAQSAIANIDSRIWLQESTKATELVQSLLEQVRLRTFVDRDNLFSLSSLHFEDFDTSPGFEIKNWDVVLGSFKPSIDERNNFNRGQADYSRSPVTGEAKFRTGFYRNNAAVTQTGRTIGKLIVFPNLTQESDVVNQLTEILRLAGGYAEMIDVDLTPRSFLKDLGEFINIGVNIGSVEFGNGEIVGMIQEIGYNPDGLAIPTKLWSFQMINLPGYSGPAGTTGGFDISVTKET